MGCVVQIIFGRLDGYVMFQLFENPMGCYFVIDFRTIGMVL